MRIAKALGMCMHSSRSPKIPNAQTKPGVFFQGTGAKVPKMGSVQKGCPKPNPTPNIMRVFRFTFTSYHSHAFIFVGVKS